MSKHLAFITSIITDGNPTTGFEIANEAVVDGLRALGHKVSVVGFRLPRQREVSDPETHVLEILNVENVEAGPLKKIEWLGRSFIKGLPVSAGKLTGFPAEKLAEIVAGEEFFDGYVLNSYQMPAAFPGLIEKPYIYLAHNLEHRSAEENAVAATSVVRRCLYRREARVLKTLEQRLCNGANYVWSLSEDDRVLLDVTDERSCTLPLVTPGLLREASDMPKRYDIGIIGTWTWQPNMAGLHWFLTEVVPMLPADMSIAVAGRVPGDVNQTQTAVSFLGHVQNAQDFLNTVRVVPLISQGGTGVQLKTIEAFQSGLSCVATSSSLRGIEMVPENCIRADKPEDFAVALATLVAGARDGALPKGDGTAFFGRQKKALLEGLARGVAALD